MRKYSFIIHQTSIEIPNTQSTLPKLSNSLIQKRREEEQNRLFFKEDINTANKHIQKVFLVNDDWGSINQNSEVSLYSITNDLFKKFRNNYYSWGYYWKGTSHSLLMELLSGSSPTENGLETSQKVRIVFPYDPEIPPPGYLPREH